MLELIRKKIEKAVKAAGYDLPASFNLEEPPNSKMGDYATNIALTIASHQKKNLREVAEDIRQQLLRDSDIKSIEVAGPGFINFSLDPQFHFEYAQNMVSAKLPDIGQGKKVVLEHTNVNPNKALHIGHLRNACLGNSCQKILTALGHNVEAQYYVDDTGVQVAVTLLGMLGLQPVNSENKKYDHFAQDVYVQTMERLETDDLLKCKQAEIIESLDQQKGELAIEAKEMATKVIYSNLETMCNMNVDYDLLVWESDILKNGFWEKAFSILREKNLKSFVLEKSGKNAGCWVIKGVLGEDKVIVKSNGVVTYTGKDVAYHLWKFNLLGKDFLYKEWPHRLQKKSLFTTAQNGERSDKFGRGDIVVNFIDVRQTLPQLAVKESLRLLGYEKQAENLKHIDYGVVFLAPSTAKELGVDTSDNKERYAMSGRKGIGILVDDLIALVKKKIMEEYKNSKQANDIAVAAIKYYMLKFNPKSDIVFDLDQALDLQGNTGPYLQYAYARSASILDKAKSQGIEINYNISGENYNSDEIMILKKINAIESAIVEAGLGYAPHILCNYLFELAQIFNRYYSKYRILGERDQEIVKARLILTKMVKSSLGKGLDLLGIQALEKM